MQKEEVLPEARVFTLPTGLRGRRRSFAVNGCWYHGIDFPITFTPPIPELMTLPCR